MTLDGKVLIVGGGLAGLTLANVLQHHDIPYQVFERDAGPDARDQGFSLNVHFCLEPLGKSINPVKFAKFGRSCAVDPERPESTELRLVDGRTSKVLHEPFRGNDLNQKPEMYRVCRSRLRSWLMEGIDVQWNKQIDHYTATPEKVRITFTDGTEATGSILVGADGINSAVCEQLLGSEEFKKSTVQNPVSNLSATYLIDQATRDVYDKFSKTHMIVLGRYQQMCTRLFISLVDVDRTAQEARYKMMWSVSCIDPDEPLLETDAQKLERAKALVTEFDTPFKNLVHNTPADVPVNRWPLRERSPHAILETHPEFDRVVLIGDAAHGLTPYRGEGGNHAMLDAVLLGNALTNVQSGKRNLNEAIDDFYNEMLPRTRKAVAESHDASITMHGPPEQVEQLLQRTLNHYKERMKQLKKEEA